jgi:hypothetical protein
MLHVRAVSPAALTNRLTRALAADPGVVNLVKLPAAASCPDGDAVQFDVISKSANQVLQRLVGLGALGCIRRLVVGRRGPGEPAMTATTTG